MAEKRDARALFQMLFCEIGAPIIVYHVLHLLGASSALSLAAAAAVSISCGFRWRRFADDPPNSGFSHCPHPMTG